MPVQGGQAFFCSRLQRRALPGTTCGSSPEPAPSQACRLTTLRLAQDAQWRAEAGAGTARLEGAYQALNSMPLYRLVSRSSSALAGLMAAIMASLSGAQASPQAHDTISRLFAQLVMKYIPPPDLRYLQVPLPALPRVQACHEVHTAGLLLNHPCNSTDTVAGSELSTCWSQLSEVLGQDWHSRCSCC